MAGIELIEAVAGQKNKASNYNENFNRMKAYIEASMEESEEIAQDAKDYAQSYTQDYVQQQLTTYSNINTLATSGTISLASNTINKIAPTGTVTFSLPTITDNTKFYQILVQVKLSSLTTINFGTTRYFDAEAPVINKTGYYDIIYAYDCNGSFWCVMAIYKGAI